MTPPVAALTPRAAPIETFVWLCREMSARDVCHCAAARLLLVAAPATMSGGSIFSAYSVWLS